MHLNNLQTQLDFDPISQPYFNVQTPLDIVNPYLSFLEKRIPHKDYLSYTKNQQKRDGNKHHITIINPFEYPQIDDKKLALMVNYPLNVNMLGVGHIKEPDNEVYFIVCESKELSRIRSLFNLSHQDFHITLGFKKSDIFDQSKGRNSLITPYNEIENYE